MAGERAAKISLVSLVIILGLALRITTSFGECLWFDEIFSVHAATNPWSDFLPFIALDLIHPPFFYFILKVWIAAGGEGLMWLRTLPILLWVIALIPFSLLARELKLSFNSYLLALCFLVFSGTVLKYSIELRMYSLMLCLSLFSAWIFVRYLNRGYGLGLLAAINLILVYTHYFAWFVIGAEVLIAAFLYRDKLQTVLAMAAIEFTLFIPWIVTVWNASSQSEGLRQNIGWMLRPGPSELIKYILNLFEPLYFQTSTAEPVSIWWITIPLILLVVVGSLIAVALNGIRDSSTVVILSAFAFLPLIAVFAVSWITPYSIWGTRHLMIVFAPIYLLIGAIIFGNPGRTMKRVMAVGFLGLFVSAAIVSSARERPRASWCEVASLSRDLGASQLPVYAVEDLIAYQLWFEGRNQAQRTLVRKLTGIDGIREDKAYFLPRGLDEVAIVDIAALDHQRLWLFVRGKVVSENEPPVRNLLVKGYRISDRRMAESGGEQIGAYLMER
jgi:uncharacterized membrane protein